MQQLSCNAVKKSLRNCMVGVTAKKPGEAYQYRVEGVLLTFHQIRQLVPAHVIDSTLRARLKRYDHTWEALEMTPAQSRAISNKGNSARLEKVGARKRQMAIENNVRRATQRNNHGEVKG